MNTNIEELYKKKYLKYKAKYLNIQRGGVFSNGKNHPNYQGVFSPTDKLVTSIDTKGEVSSMIFDDKGNVLVVDKTNNSIKKFNMRNGEKVSWSDGKEEIQLMEGSIVISIAFNTNGELYSCETHGRIKSISALLYEAGVRKPEHSFTGNSTSSIAFHLNKVYFIEDKLSYIDFAKDSSTIIRTEIWMPGGQSMAFDREGNIVIADPRNNCIKAFKLHDKQPLYTIGNTIGKNSLQFKSPVDFAFDFAGAIYVADKGNNRVLILDYKKGIALFQYSINQPTSVAIDGEGRILVGAEGKIRVLKFKDFQPFVPDIPPTPPTPQKRYTITTVNIEDPYLKFLRNYDPETKVIESEIISSETKIKGVDDNDKNNMIEHLRSIFPNATFEKNDMSSMITISLTNVNVDWDMLLINLKKMFQNSGSRLAVYASANYKHTIMTANEDAVRYLLTIRKKNQDLEDNKLTKLNERPPLPSK